jgi:phosphatidylglycerophosphate synthase|tara:strand:+ start:13 stop:618 length:606 start_codon:yes stop_codon:yes gene_type:complete
MNNGRKISRDNENPIDNILYDISGEVIKVFKIFNFTPNMITTISLLITLIGINNIYNGNYKIGAILYFIGYLFDCMDGNYARTYNMTSKFGSIYDPVSDHIKSIFLIICIYLLKINSKTKILFGIIFVIFSIISYIYIGCQEKIINQDNKNKSVLEFLTFLCPNIENIKYLRYFGSGTTNFITSLFIFNIKFINKFINKFI